MTLKNRTHVASEKPFRHPMTQHLYFDLTPERARRHSVFAVVPRFNLATLITMIETMRVANYLSPRDEYSWEIVSFDGPRVAASNGFTITAENGVHVSSDADFVFVLASWGAEHYSNRNLTSWVRRRARSGETVCGVELGCYILARAGLLDGKTATTHWSWLNGFQESFEKIDVREQTYTITNRVLTCAGGLTGIDLMMHLIERAHGAAFAQEVADQMLLSGCRTDTAAQREDMRQGTAALPPTIRQAITVIEKNLEDPLSVPDIARSVGLSQRQLERTFKGHIGCTVVQFSLLLRLQRARLLLISTRLSVREIATASGFNTLPHFANSFRKVFGRKPSEYRDSWPQDQAVPTWPGTLSEFLSSLQTKK